MNRTIIDLPDILCSLVSDWIINVRGRAGSDAVDGSGQVVYGAQPRWEGAMTLPGFKSERVREINAFVARMRGRVNVVRVSICNAFGPTLRDMQISRFPFERGIVSFRLGVPWGIGVGSGYSPAVLTTAARAAGAVTIPVNTTALNNPIKIGHYVSHNDWPYIVVGVSGTGASTVLTVEPPLRRAIASGQSIKLRATALMAFETDMEGRLALQMGKRGEAVLNLVEWTARA